VILPLIAAAEAGGAGLRAACAIVGVSQRTVERWRARPDGDDRRCGPRHEAANALSASERARVVAVMAAPEHAGLSPRQLVPRLADEGRYLASESTMYRLQHRFGLRASRRAERRTHVTRATAVHRAEGPCQVWSWDITWLPTVVRGRYLYLYVVMDVWSRRIVGWDVCEREAADLAASLIQRTCVDHDVNPQGLILHSDNGKPMRGATMIATLQWLGVVPSFSRPHVSNDNPYSEALFRTLKHTPASSRRVCGWPASSLGTTARTATAASATSHPTSGTLAVRLLSSPDAKRSTRAHGTSVQHAGRVAHGTGRQSAP
jgi:transposase InsO family protein